MIEQLKEIMAGGWEAVMLLRPRLLEASSIRPIQRNGTPRITIKKVRLEIASVSILKLARKVGKAREPSREEKERESLPTRPVAHYSVYWSGRASAFINGSPPYRLVVRCASGAATNWNAQPLGAAALFARRTAAIDRHACG